MSTLSKKILEVESGGMRLFASKVPTKDILTIEGSILGGPRCLPRGKGVIASLTAELLDAGTTKHSKLVFRTLLADKGISLSFSSVRDRIFFSASALPEDYETVLALLSECLQRALMDEKELVLVKEREQGELLEAATDTRTQASIALSRLLYSPAHPNYEESIEETKKALAGVTRKEVYAHYKTLGRKGLLFVVVGDIAPKEALKKAIKYLSKLPEGSVQLPIISAEKALPVAVEKRVGIKDKANVDTYFGSAVPVTVVDDTYYPLSVAISMLGGRGLSTGHLMRTIRERDGLTYGIYGSLSGCDVTTTGFIRIWATFAPTVYSGAIERVKREIALFLKTGITEQTLRTKKDEMKGSYQVSLATSHGLASALHTIALHNKKLSFIDEFPQKIESISLQQVQDVAPVLAPSNLAIAASGTFTD